MYSDMLSRNVIEHNVDATEGLTFRANSLARVKIKGEP